MRDASVISVGLQIIQEFRFFVFGLCARNLHRSWASCSGKRLAGCGHKNGEVVQVWNMGYRMRDGQFHNLSHPGEGLELNEPPPQRVRFTVRGWAWTFVLPPQVFFLHKISLVVFRPSSEYLPLCLASCRIRVVRHGLFCTHVAILPGDCAFVALSEIHIFIVHHKE